MHGWTPSTVSREPTVAAQLGSRVGSWLGSWLGWWLGSWRARLPQTWAASLAFAQLASRWHTPLRLMRFLEDARERDVLRTVGPVYQFRHARMQDRLGGQVRTVTHPDHRAAL